MTKSRNAVRVVEDTVLPIDQIEYEENLGRVGMTRVAPRWLVDNIRQIGLLNPITVQKIGPDRYRLVAGANRLLSLRELNEKFIRCSVRDFASEAHARMAALSENIHRDGVTLYEKTVLVHRIVTVHDADPIEVAARLALTTKDVRVMIRACEVFSRDQMAFFERVAKTSYSYARRFLLTAAIASTEKRNVAIQMLGTESTTKSRRMSTSKMTCLRSFLEESGDPETLPFYRGRALTPRERMLSIGLIDLILGERVTFFDRPGKVLAIRRRKADADADADADEVGEAVPTLQFYWKSVGRGKKKPPAATDEKRRPKS